MLVCCLQGPPVSLAPVAAPTGACKAKQPGGARTSKMTSTTRRFSTVAEVRKAAKKAARTLQRVHKRRRRRRLGRAARRALKRRWRKRVREMRAAEGWRQRPPATARAARNLHRWQRSLPPLPQQEQRQQATPQPASSEPMGECMVRARQFPDSACTAGQASPCVSADPGVCCHAPGVPHTAH